MTRVLVVDDHPIVLQGCRRMLQDAGINDVFEAPDPETGYRLYCSHTPEVVIVDLGMQDKGLSGLELIRRIRGHDAHVRILVFSMHSDPVIVVRALQAGATGYVVKDTSMRRNSSRHSRACVTGTPYLSGGTCQCRLRWPIRRRGRIRSPN